MGITVLPLEELKGCIGEEKKSEWMEISQERINQFADCTDDHQFIHVDVEKSKAGPFGTTIAHGFLTLSLLTKLASDASSAPGSSATAYMSQLIPSATTSMYPSFQLSTVSPGLPSISSVL